MKNKQFQLLLILGAAFAVSQVQSTSSTEPLVEDGVLVLTEENFAE
jgi:hypothetical protein